MLGERPERRRPPGDGAGHHRRPPRHASARREGAPPGRCRRSDRVFWLGALGRERWTLEERLHALERKEFVTPRAPKLRGRRGRVLASGTRSSRRRIRADPARRAGGQAPCGRGVDRVARPPRGPRGDARPPLRSRLSSTPGPPVRTSSPLARAGSGRVCETQAIAPSLSTRFDAAARYFDAARSSSGRDDPERPELLLPARSCPSADAATIGRRARSRTRARLPLAAGRPRARGRGRGAPRRALVVSRGDRDRSASYLERAYALVAGRFRRRPRRRTSSARSSRYRVLRGAHEEAIRDRRRSVRYGRGAWARRAAGARALQHRHRQGASSVTPAASTTSSAPSTIARAAGSLRGRARAQQSRRSQSGSLGDLRRGRKLHRARRSRMRERLGVANLVRFSRNVRALAPLPGGRLERRAPANRGVPGSMRRRHAALPRGRHAPPTGSRPAGAGRRRRCTRRRSEDRAARTERRRSPAARSRGSRGARDSCVEAGRRRRGASAALEESLEDEACECLTVRHRRSRARREGARSCVSELLARARSAARRRSGPKLRERATLGDYVRARRRVRRDRTMRELECARPLHTRAEQLVAEGRHAEADAQLERALAFWRSVGATRYIRQAEALARDASEVSA